MKIEAAQKIQPTADPDVVRTANVSPVITLIGTALSLWGSLLAVPCLYLLLAGDRPPVTVTALAATAAVGAALFLVGVRFLRGPDIVIIDRRRGHIVTRKKRLLGSYDIELSLAPFDLVSVTKEMRGAAFSGPRWIRYPVRLVERRTGTQFTVAALPSQEQGRSAGEMLAKFLSRPLSDATSGKTLVREAHELDRSVADRARGEIAQVPQRPQTLRASAKESEGAVEVRLATSGLKLDTCFLCTVAIVFASFLISFSVKSFVAVVAVIVIVALARSFRFERISVTHDRLSLTVYWFGIPWIRAIPLSELEEFELADKAERKHLHEMLQGTRPSSQEKRKSPPGFLANHPGILAKSDRRTLVIGRGQPLDDICYVFALLRRYIMQAHDAAT